MTLEAKEVQPPHSQLNDEDRSRQLCGRLKDTLRDVIRRRTIDFSGVGIIVSDVPESLPLFPLSKTGGATSIPDIVSSLVAISSRHSDHHDGFHIISSAGQLTRVAQYFSPPIIADAEVDRSKRFGGRYLAALFGSGIRGVLVSGIASEGFGIAIFRGGKEVYYEDIG